MNKYFFLFHINRSIEMPESLIHQVMKLYDVEMNEALYLLIRDYYDIKDDIEEGEQNERFKM